MEINITGEKILVDVPFSEQNSVREIEKSIDELYNSWRIKFPRKAPMELLAMIAYQYASYYADLRKRYDAVARSVERADLMLDSILKS